MDKSPAEMFVEARMKANLEAVGGETNKIRNVKTGESYTDTEWGKLGSVTMRPTDADIEDLKLFKGTSDYLSGAKVADDLISAMDAGANRWTDKPLASTNISELKSLDMIKAYKDNPDFQEGFINRFGAERFLQLKERLAGDAKYGDLMRTSLSKASNNQGGFAKTTDAGGKTADVITRNTNSITTQIAQKADITALARLTNDAAHPQSKDFLIETAKKVIDKNTGLDNFSRINQDGTTVFVENIKPETAQILEAVSKSPEAALELMQNKDFVKQAAYIGAIDDKNTTIANLMKAATSPEIRERGNGQKIDNAIKNIAEVYGETDSITPGQKQTVDEDAIKRTVYQRKYGGGCGGDLPQQFGIFL